MTNPSLNIITANSQHTVYNHLFTLMGTTATGYGATLLSEPVDPGQIIHSDVWVNMQRDIERCLIHQVGTSTNNIITANTGTIIRGGTPARMYTQLQFLESTRGQVYPTHLRSITFNTTATSAGIWTSTNFSSTATMIGNNGGGYMTSVHWAWSYPNQMNYFFNLGGEIRPEISIGAGRTLDRWAWYKLIDAANNVKFGLKEYLEMLQNGGTYEYKIVGGGTANTSTVTAPALLGTTIVYVDTTSYRANGIIVKFKIDPLNPNQLIGTLNFVAGLGKGSKKKHSGKKVFATRYIAVQLQIVSDFRTQYTVEDDGGISSPMPQMQIVANRLSARPSPLPQFGIEVGETSNTQTVVLVNNTTQTCSITNISLRNPTEIQGHVTPTSLSIPAHSTSSFNVYYTGVTPGNFRGYIDIVNTANPLTLITEVNVGSVNPHSLILTTTTNDLIVQDFVVDHAGGNYRKFTVSFTGVSGYTCDTELLDIPDTFRVTFNPFELPNGTYTAEADIVIYPLDSSTEPVYISTPIRITTNVRYENIGYWESALGYNDTKLGITYDWIGGKRYLTVGIGQGNPLITNLDNESAWPAWEEVYRIPIGDNAATYYTKDYIIKGDGSLYGDYFGVGTAEGSILTIKNLRYGNLSILLNTLNRSSSDSGQQASLDGLSAAFDYYNGVVPRNTQLEMPAVDLTTQYFEGFDKSGNVNTCLIPANIS